MPRKRNEQSNNFNKAFPATMRKLMDERGTTQNELADYLLKTRQSISYYCDGSSAPDWETIVKIADFFDISTDYLLGRTKDPNRNPCAADELGLSANVVKLLRHCNSGDTLNDAIKGLNLLLDGVDGLSFLIDVKSIYEISESIRLGTHVSIFDDKVEDWLLTDKVSELTDRIVAEELEKELIDKYPDLLGKIRVSCGLESIDYEIKRISSSFEQQIRMITKYYESYYKGRLTYQESGGTNGND